MDLRTKLLLGVGIALLFAFSAVALFSVVSMQASYERLEIAETKDATATVMSALRTDMKSTYSTARDYSAWTATYRYAEGENPDWIRENMGPDFFSRFALDRVLIFNSTGSLIFSMQFNDTSLHIEPASGVFIDDIERFNIAKKTLESGNGSLGILETSAGPVLIASHPILTDDYQGPPAGSLHLSRQINAEYLADLQERTGTSISVIPAPELFSNASFASAAAQFASGEEIAVEPLDVRFITGYVPLVDQEPPADYYLAVTHPRTIYQTGMTGIATFLVSFAVAGICIILFTLVFFDRIVLSRLNTIIRSVKSRKAAEHISKEIVPEEEDELSQLAVTIDPVFTELAESREKMAESEERYRTLAESAQDLIFIIDRDDTVTYVNAFASRAFGLPKSEIIGKPRSRLFPGLVGEGQRRSLNHVLTTGEPLRIEGSLPLPAGEIWQETLLVPIRDLHGIITGVMGISRDLTKRKMAEDALVTAHKKLTLISTITRHDILNQLTALATYLELSRDYTDNDRAKNFIEKELQIAALINREINFTRDFEDVGAGTPVWHNVNATISGVNRTLMTGNVAVEIGFSDIEIYADSLLEKVFFNLIDNAIRYGGPGISVIRFSAQENAGSLIIRCEDNGVGIPPEDKVRIFDQGYGNHTGLGLFLCREILGITGLTITETGTFGSGARFDIIVPQGKWRHTGQDSAG
jgi:PAS domain S-box-containing protein